MTVVWIDTDAWKPFCHDFYERCEGRMILGKLAECCQKCPFLLIEVK